MLRTIVHQLFYLFLPSFPHRLYLLSSCVISVPSFPPPLSFLPSSLFSLLSFFPLWVGRPTNQPTQPTHPPERLIWRRSRWRIKKRGKKEILFVLRGNRTDRDMHTWWTLGLGWLLLGNFWKKKRKKNKKVFRFFFRFLFCWVLGSFGNVGLGCLGVVYGCCLFVCSIVVAFVEEGSRRREERRGGWSWTGRWATQKIIVFVLCCFLYLCYGEGELRR